MRSSGKRSEVYLVNRRLESFLNGRNDEIIAQAMCAMPKASAQDVSSPLQLNMRLGIIIALLALFISSCVATRSSLPVATTKIKPLIEKKTMAPVQIPQSAKLIIGAGGIYAAFLYYGTLQEDVFHYVAADGTKFKAAWFLQFLGEKIVQTRPDYYLKLYRSTSCLCTC